jgi:hypothetical protein
MEPPTEHPTFDAICAQLDEFQPIPAVTPNVDVHVPETPADRDAQSEPIDELILAGLVSL